MGVGKWIMALAGPDIWIRLRRISVRRGKRDAVQTHEQQGYCLGTGYGGDARGGAKQVPRRTMKVGGLVGDGGQEVMHDGA